jgi:hypothetical protein
MKSTDIRLNSLVEQMKQDPRLQHPAKLTDLADLCRALIEAAEADGVEVTDGNVVDLVADQTTIRGCPAALEDIRSALVVAGLGQRFLKATRRGQPHDRWVYFIKEAASGTFVAIRHGEQGYHPTTVYTQEHADCLNQRQGNTEAELEAATICSMFGNWENFSNIVEEWDRPKTRP